MGGGSTPDRRRPKAALFLLACGAAGVLPHALPAPFQLLPALSLAVLLGGYVSRTVLRPLFREDSAVPVPPVLGPLTGAPEAAQPVQAGSSSVDVVVAARDEEAVIGRLVERLSRLRWPEGLLTFWVIDDGSLDGTPQRLAALQADHDRLRVLRRSRDAGGGKSGALNLVLRQLRGRWMLVLDADADLTPDLLERLIPFAEAGGWSAVQLRKAETNAQDNWLTRAQAMEMAFDAFIQEARLGAGGVAELRGNGQLLRRDAVEAAGGFNEATITDDLDLSFRLLLAGQPVGVLWDPPVAEEAVLTLPALWRQRQRWAEGGLQRFLDYGGQLFRDPVRPEQRLDLAAFFVLQYMLPSISAADLIGGLLTGTAPLMWPFSVVALALSAFALAVGCSRGVEGPAVPPPSPANLALAMVYLMHWFVVIPWVSLRMALLPKSLVWAKTAHGVGRPGEETPALIDPDEVGSIEVLTESGGT